MTAPKRELRTTRDGRLEKATDRIVQRAEDSLRVKRLEALVDEAAHRVTLKAAQKHRQAKQDAFAERITGSRPARTLRERILGVDHPRPPRTFAERILGVDPDDE